MSEFNMESYQSLADTGFVSKEQVLPEDEFFHSIYIAGQTRKNHINIEEQTGKFQVRGVEYNMGHVCMIITNVKDVLVNVHRDQQNKEIVDCFSYKSGQLPWKGTSGRICGLNAAERAANPECKDCRSQIIISGIYCDNNGKPLVNEDNKPVFVFIRGKGMKYANVSNYLNEMYKKDLPPIFTPETDESKKFEKAVVNNKRFVTIITKEEAQSKYGIQLVFSLTSGIQLDDDTVKNILKISKKTIIKFNEKFDWSKTLASPNNYGDQPPAQGVLPVKDDNIQESPQSPQSPPSSPDTQAKAGEGSFMDFDEVNF